MAEFTEIEEQLLERVTDDRLRTSLAEIRQAAEDIWADDAPRIIQDYTDHGITHSERLAGFAAKLLEANDGRPLSAEEMYLLLAGIYLHDIGMQCDVVKFSKIQARAEALGAQFDVEFTAQTASSYSIEEQKAIRKNHQYLTAAWIDHANRTGANVLGPAAKTIPEELVDDLMDVCKHHAKVPITDCPLTFRFDPTGRKQLVAALLRFADELDVDGHRVSIETVKNFRLHPRNSVYWWLHNRTKVIFSARNVIILTIRLHPDDVKQHGSFVHDAFITEFQSKNRPGLSVLARDGIPIVISADSKVVEHDRAEPLPPEIVQALQAMQQKGDSLTELADEVRTWLQAIRYEVSEPQQRDDRTVDMLATLDLGTVKQRVLVRCIGGEVTPADVDALDQVLDRKTPQGWLISDKRVSDRARERAAEDDAFQVFTLADFLRQMVWGPYFDALTALVEKDQIPDLYVDLGCYKQEMGEEGREIGRDRYASLDAYIDNWLTERGKMHISLLGEFGTGKTWFCRHYAYRQLQCYLNDPANERLPLLITLRAFAKAMTVQQLINDVLLEQYKLPFVGSAFEVFQEMNRRGKLLLILDGFDEMARQVDYQTVVDNFWELAELVDEGSKVILTSRTEYFRWAKESEKILGGEEFGRRTIVLSPPRFEVLYLEPFSDDQIREVITRRLGTEDGPSVAGRILEAENLAEMARKPVLVELLLAALEELEEEVSADVLENPAQVYLYATNRLLLRNIDTKRTFTTTSDKLYFLCELAWEMIQSGELRIHYMDIPERIEAYFGDQIKDQHELDTWDYDLRAQTLLHRDAAGYYEFAHKSLAEYFVAFKFAAELGCLAPEFTQAYCEADGRPCKVPVEQKDITGLAETFGAMALTDERMWAVRDLLPGLIAEDAAGQLWQVIDKTKGKTPEQVKYASGNAATLLRIMGESFVGAKLAHTVLCGADLQGSDLTKIDLQRAYLREINLSDCTLRAANLREANLSGVFLDEIRVNYAFAVSPDGNSLTKESREGTVDIYDLLTNQRVQRIDPGAGIIMDIAYSPKGSCIAILCWDDTDKSILQFWQVFEFDLLFHIQIDLKLYKILYDPAARYVAGGGDTGVVGIWDANTGQDICMLQGHRDSTMALAFSPDGSLLATGSNDQTVNVWSVDSWKLLYSIDTTEQIQSTQSSSFVWAVAFSADSKQLAAAISWARVVGVWDVESGNLVALLKGFSGAVEDVAYNSEGSLLVGLGRDMLRIWDAHTFVEVASVLGPCVRGSFDEPMERDSFCFGNVAFVEGLNALAVSTYDGTVRMWDIETCHSLPPIDPRTDWLGANLRAVKGLDSYTIQWLKERGAVE